ncbi:MAG: indolepyruvate ferredoxin oxidoreductase [Deltaproteobacteria bacterium]|nr:indolepyruvate ferredoxin oxidoreductase [Deltaproteobacteria bacterium]
MKQEIKMLLGDEAVAFGAIHAGISAAYAYPGTPATEIQEAVQKYSALHPDAKIKADWSINEKVAYEEALGCSLIGLRSMVSFKHVGLNVAADPFMSSMITGANGGLAVVPCDDPGMHSSQNEQDSRFYAFFAQIPCLEPIDAQEAYDMTREAFDISERFKIPVMVRSVARLSHTRGKVRFSGEQKQNKLKIPENFTGWNVLPSNARAQYDSLLSKQADFIKWSNSHPANRIHIEKGAATGVIATGLGFNYFMEAASSSGGASYSYLRVATYPVPEQKIRELLKNVSTLIVIEEGNPLIERLIWKYIAETGKKIAVKGKLSGDLPSAGELNTESVRVVLGLAALKSSAAVSSDIVRGRPPQLCKGCPHADTFYALNKALAGKTEKVVFSDIGCYTLGFYPPFKAIDSCVCMGASVGMAKAASENGLKYSVAVLGESTFNHSGITPMLEGIKRKSPFTVIILDNSTTAMTGGQDTICIGEDLEKVVLGLGLEKEHLRVVNPIPKNLDENAAAILQELEYEGPSVVIARRECLQIR